VKKNALIRRTYVAVNFVLDELLVAEPFFQREVVVEEEPLAETSKSEVV
jgi:hypothetical protein